MSCEKGQKDLPDEAMQGIALQDMLGEEEYWEGNKLEYIDLFFTNDNDLFSGKILTKHILGLSKFVPEKVLLLSLRAIQLV